MFHRRMGSNAYNSGQAKLLLYVLNIAPVTFSKIKMYDSSIEVFQS